MAIREIKTFELQCDHCGMTKEVRGTHEREAISVMVLMSEWTYNAAKNEVGCPLHPVQSPVKKGRATGL